LIKIYFTCQLCAAAESIRFARRRLPTPRRPRNLNDAFLFLASRYDLAQQEKVGPDQLRKFVDGHDDDDNDGDQWYDARRAIAGGEERTGKAAGKHHKEHKEPAAVGIR
jgi:hypothetical protein